VRPLADGLESFEDLDVIGAVIFQPVAIRRSDLLLSRLQGRPLFSSAFVRA
jgi:hypothetical protein